MLQYPFATVLTRSAGDLQYDLGATAGASGAATRFELTFGLVLPPIAHQRYRIGAWVDQRSGDFAEQGLPNRRVGAYSGSLALSLEWVRGDY
jgi:hypothetical protein